MGQPKNLLVFGNMFENIEHANKVKLPAEGRVPDVCLNKGRP